MATTVIMPRQGQSVESCIISEFHKKVGDTVAVGDVLFEYETDKASFQEEAQVAGTVLAVFAEEGDEIPVLENVMVIGEAGETVDSPAAPAVVEEAPAPKVEAAPKAAPVDSNATAVIMPRQGQSVESCIITEFHKKVGDTVAIGDVLFEYETDKASFQEEAQVEGTVLAVFAEDGDEIPVLENVMLIGAEGDSIEGFAGAAASDVAVAEEAPKAEAKAAAPVAAPKATSGKSTGFISPRAKKLADKEGVDTSELAGSGPNGRIIERDIQAAAAAQPKVTPLAKKVAASEALPIAEKGSGLGGAVKANDLTAPVNPVYGEDSVVEKLPNIRKLIAKAMHASLQNSAQLTHHLGADARQLMAMRKKVKAALADGYQHNLTLNDMICYAVIQTLKKYPNVNAHFLGDSVRKFNKVHLGLAVDTERGLMVPTIKNADDLSIQGLSSQMKQLANACKTGSIDPELLNSEGASFTVSNLGNYGVEMFTPVINLPQVGILGVNTIVPRAKDLGDGVYGFVPYLGLSLTYDHQALDGGEATRFVKDVANAIESLDFQL